MDRRTFNVSLVLGWNERYDHKVAVGIIKFAHRRKLWRLSGNEWLFRQKQSGRQKVDGIIARITNLEEHRRIVSLGVPVVDIANAYAESAMPRVLNDDILTGKLAAAHLKDKGFPHFGYVGIDETSWSNLRKIGMREAVREHSDAQLHCHSVGISWLKREPSLAGLTRWLKTIPLPCGILAANDLLGYRVSIAAEMAGIKIPQQLGVVGVDNDDVFCELSQPTLTSITCDCERIGMEAATLLGKILAGDSAPQQVVVPPLGIAERESTNIMFGKDRVVVAAKKFILANVGKGINVTDVVAACNISRRALERRFLKVEEKSLHEAIHTARLELAKDLLMAGKTVAETSYGSGYRTVQHFYHAFKDRFGMTPRDYVKSIPPYCVSRLFRNS